MAGTAIVLRGATGIAAAGATALAIPEIAVATVVVGGVIVVGTSVLMAVSWLTGNGVSFSANRNGLGFNIGPGSQSQAKR